MTEREEAERLVRLFIGRDDQLIALLSNQLGVLKAQAQVLMGLCSLCITVTGFSGHRMVNGGPAALGSMVVGVGLILVAVILSVRTISQLRWVSQDLSDAMVQTAEVVITRRNKQQRSLARAAVFVSFGLAAYLLAVVLAAFHAG